MSSSCENSRLREGRRAKIDPVEADEIPRTSPRHSLLPDHQLAHDASHAFPCSLVQVLMLMRRRRPAAVHVQGAADALTAISSFQFFIVFPAQSEADLLEWTTAVNVKITHDLSE